MTYSYKPLSEDQYKKISETAFDYSRKTLLSEAPDITNSMLWDDNLIASFKYPDGKSGFCITNGNSSFMWDDLGNFNFATGEPSQAGCGGKMVFNSKDKIEKSQTVAIEVTGADVVKDTTKDEKTGDIKKEEEPAYSLKVYGKVAIEAVGGDVSIKGDNISINAVNSLNMTAGKDVNITAGKNGGNVNINGGTIKIDASFLKKKITSGEYADGTAEVEIDQVKPGSKTIISSVGSITHSVAGDYEMGAKNINIDATLGWMKLSSTTDFAVSSKGNYVTEVTGSSKYSVLGVSASKAKPTSPTYEVSVSGPGAINPKVPNFKISSAGNAAVEVTKGGFEVTSGAKALSKFSFDEKKGEWRVGAKLGYISMDPKGVEMGYIKTSSLRLDAVAGSLSAPAIFLN